MCSAWLKLPRGGFRLLKRGTARCIFTVDVGVAGICTVIVCKAHRNAKHANTRGLGACLLQEILKITLSEIESKFITL